METLILLGIAHFFAGRDSATRNAFRSALTLDPGLTAGNLAALDPELAGILESERAARAAGAHATVTSHRRPGGDPGQGSRVGSWSKP
ncbi:MAG: hypothetical protein ACREL9_03085 [Gemmatimonadales bacterium]